MTESRNEEKEKREGRKKREAEGENTGSGTSKERGRSVKSHGHVARDKQRGRGKSKGEKCTHLAYPADRRKLNQAEVCLRDPRLLLGRGRKSMRKCSPWNNLEESL